MTIDTISIYSFNDINIHFRVTGVYKVFWVHFLSNLLVSFNKIYCAAITSWLVYYFMLNLFVQSIFNEVNLIQMSLLRANKQTKDTPKTTTATTTEQKQKEALFGCIWTDFFQTWHADRCHETVQSDASLNDFDSHSHSQGCEKSRTCAITMLHMFVMIDHVSKMTSKKNCKYGEYGSHKHFFSLYKISFCLYWPPPPPKKKQQQNPCNFQGCQLHTWHTCVHLILIFNYNSF